MKGKKTFSGTRKNIIIGALMLTSFLILLPNFIKVIDMIMAPYTDDEIIITTVSYSSEGLPDGEDNLIVGNLYQPSPKFSDKEYPTVIACHGFLAGFGKESMHRWCVEVCKRGFVVLSIDLPGAGMSTGEMDTFPREDFEPVIIKDGIKFLKGYDFVDGSKIGLMGISYGGATVSMASGVLGDYVDATISMNGFTNTTNWLIESILPDAGFKFSVREDYIRLKTVDDRKVTEENIKDFLALYGVIRGNEELIEDLIIPGTTKLDRDFLKKFDAVEYLDGCKDDSVMFIHSKDDDTFGEKNQSGQGYDAIIKAGKKAHYVRVDDNHQLMDDPKYRSDYIIINFFEEKLKGKDLGDKWDDDYEKYTQKRDIELTISKEFGFEIFYETLIYFFLSLIPFFLIISIIYYNKKFTNKRAEIEENVLIQEREDGDFIDFSFGRGSYTKTAIFLGLLYFIAYLAMIGLGMGFFSDIIAGFLCAAFYFVMFLTLYHLPDQAEVDLWERLKGEGNIYNKRSEETEDKIFDINGALILFGIIAFTIVIGLIGSQISTLPTFYKQPLEQIFRTMCILGILMLIAGIFLIYFLEKNSNEGINYSQINWGKYDLSKYGILKSITFGSILFLNFFFQYCIWAFYMKFPMMMGPHSLYYILMVLAVLTFFGGVQLLIKIIKEITFKDNLTIVKESKKNIKLIILVEVIVFFIGIFMLGIITYMAFYPLLNTELFGDLTIILVLLICGVYVITSIVKIFCVEKGIFGISIFFPLILFVILIFHFHI